MQVQFPVWLLASLHRIYYLPYSFAGWSVSMCTWATGIQIYQSAKKAHVWVNLKIWARYLAFFLWSSIKIGASPSFTHNRSRFLKQQLVTSLMKHQNWSINTICGLALTRSSYQRIGWWVEWEWFRVTSSPTGIYALGVVSHHFLSNRNLASRTTSHIVLIWRSLTKIWI